MEEIETTPFEQFMDKYGGKEASEFKLLNEIEKEFRKRNKVGSRFFIAALKLSMEKDEENEQDEFLYCMLLSFIFDDLPDEEKLKFTVDQAKKIECKSFIRDNFQYIMAAERKGNKLNADETLKKFLEEYDCSNVSSKLSELCIHHYKNDDNKSTNFNQFKLCDIEFLIKYKDLFTFVNELLKKYYSNFECEDFLLEIEQNPCNVFDYLAEAEKCYDLNSFLIYVYSCMDAKDQTVERYNKLSEKEKEELNDYLKTKNGSKSENLLSKICEIIKLFFAILFSLGSIASIIVGVIAIASLLTLPFSPWILVGVGIPVLAGFGYLTYKSAKNLLNLNSMANESNVKEENDDNFVIPEENGKKNNIQKPKEEEEETVK